MVKSTNQHIGSRHLIFTQFTQTIPLDFSDVLYLYFRGFGLEIVCDEAQGTDKGESENWASLVKKGVRK